MKRMVLRMLLVALIITGGANLLKQTAHAGFNAQYNNRASLRSSFSLTNQKSNLLANEEDPGIIGPKSTILFTV